MFRSKKVISLLAGLLMTASAIAQAPSSAPAGSTGMCRDGSYWSGATKKGACRGHKGVQDWYATAGAPSGGTAAAPAAPASATPAATPAAPPTAAPAAPAPKATKPAVVQAPGGGAGQVWVNTSSGVYHCSGDRWYGKTKNGAYMSEADAIAKGNRADHGKACK
jgi:hypothetical protein